MKLLLILALIVNLAGFGDIPAEGADTTVTVATQDPATGKALMSLEGSLLSDKPLTVTITRSQAGIVDEFCCAGQCTAGNAQTTETRSFTPSGIVDWYIHYTPAPDSDVQITYLFSDGTESYELRVNYHYEAQGIEPLNAQPSSLKVRKILLDNHVYILHNKLKYQIL